MSLDSRCCVLLHRAARSLSRMVCVSVMDRRAITLYSKLEIPKVTAVDGPRHAERLSGYGAARVAGPLDLDAGPAAVEGPFDVVINHVRLAPGDLAKLTAYVADGGIVVSSAGAVPADDARSVRAAGVWVAPDASHLADLVARIDRGALELHIADRRPLADLPAVHRDAGNGALSGKTVIIVG